MGLSLKIGADMYKAVRVFGLVSLAFASSVCAEEFEVSGFVIDVPTRFEGPASAEPDARSKTYAFTVPAAGPSGHVASTAGELEKRRGQLLRRHAHPRRASRPDAVVRPKLRDRSAGLDRQDVRCLAGTVEQQLVGADVSAAPAEGRPPAAAAAAMGSSSYTVGPLSDSEVCLRSFARRMRKMIPQCRSVTKP